MIKLTIISYSFGSLAATSRARTARVELDILFSPDFLCKKLLLARK
jgi:hypothetical protein